MRSKRFRSNIQLRPVPVQDFTGRSNMTRKQMTHLFGISEAHMDRWPG